MAPLAKTVIITNRNKLQPLTNLIFPVRVLLDSINELSYLLFNFLFNLHITTLSLHNIT